MTGRSDVIIAVDFGVTFTGVAFLFSNGTIHILNNWPANNNLGDIKVPSRLVYNHDNTISSWGFSSDIYDNPLPPGKREYRLFKMFLDPDTYHQAREADLPTVASPTEAMRCTTDYLREIYRHIKSTYEEMTGETNWATLSVSFLFSIPTAWRGLNVSNTFKATIRDAGFGTEGPRHSMQLCLTEAEAATVDILTGGAVNFRSGDMLLMVDAGGSRTNFSLVQVTSVNDSIPQVSQVAEISGIGIGSVLIDAAFGNLVEQRLADSPDVPAHIANGLADKMMESEGFKSIKHLFGDPSFISQVHRIPIPGASRDFRHEKLRALGGCMLFDNNEIQRLFDSHVELIMAKIEQQLNWLKENRRREQVTYTILSGGLGGSKYVQRRISEYFFGFLHPNTHRTRVVGDPHSQTAVLKGLLRSQGPSIQPRTMPVLAHFVAQASYGVVDRELYDRKRHIGEPLEEDEFDQKQSWAVNQIQWIIRKGDSINRDAPPSKQLVRRLRPDQLTTSFTTQIVRSTNEVTFLPQSMKKAGVKKLCQIESCLVDLQPEELVLKQKKSNWFSEGYKYYELAYDIHTVVTPAALRFELWFQGKKFSVAHEPIQVEWNRA